MEGELDDENADEYAMMETISCVGKGESRRGELRTKEREGRRGGEREKEGGGRNKRSTIRTKINKGKEMEKKRKKKREEEKRI